MVTLQLRESHRRQFNGEDSQSVAVDLCDQLGLSYWANGNLEDGPSEEFLTLETSPDPGCDCGFCETAEWEY